MAEAVCRPRRPGPSGRVGSAPCGRARRGATSAVPRRARAPAPRPDGRPRPRPRPSRARSARPARADPAVLSSSACRVGGTTTSSCSSPAMRQHLLDEERVAAGGPGDSSAEPAGDVHWKQLVDVLVAQRLEPKRHRPRGAAFGELRSRHADEQDRGPRGEERNLLDEIEERLLGPLDVVEDDDERPARGGVLERLPERAGDLVGGDDGLGLAEQRPDRCASASSGGGKLELLQHLDDWPVRDCLAVGEAAPADDLRVDRCAAARLRGATCRCRPSPTSVTSSQRCSVRARSQASPTE